jgi:hypothetical protein
MTEDFNKWWNSDGIAEENSYREGSPVFWAWEGWQAAVKAEREACAKLAYELTSYEGIADAIRARGQG